MIYFLMKGTEIIAEGTIKEISKETGRSMPCLRNNLLRTNERKLVQRNRSYYSLIEEHELPRYLDDLQLDKQEYAAYKEDQYLTNGTIDEIARFLGLKYSTVRAYTYPYYNYNKKGKIQLIEI